MVKWPRCDVDVDNVLKGTKQASNSKTNLINKLKCKVYPLVSRCSVRAALVEGKLKNTNEIFRCMFVENNSLMLYMLPRMYGEAPVIIKKWRIWTPLLKKVLNTHSKSIDMAIAVLPSEYHAQFKESANFKSQMLIRSFIDTSGGPEGVRKQFRYNKRRFYNKMDKNPTFSYRVSKDPKDFDLFYNEMHVPYIQKRFEELAELDSYKRMKDFFLKGFLMLIEEGNKTVAGVLCTIEDDVLVFRRTGILNGDEEYIKRGASSAQYYFILKFALEHGIQKVDLMRSRPFFHDGVYNTKRKWGAEICPDDEIRTWVFFFIPEYTRKVAKFFEINPLIIHKEDKMYGLVGWSDEVPPSKEDEKQLSEKYFSPGLNGLMLVQPHSDTMTSFLPNDTYR